MGAKFLCEEYLFIYCHIALAMWLYILVCKYVCMDVCLGMWPEPQSKRNENFRVCTWHTGDSF